MTFTQCYQECDRIDKKIPERIDAYSNTIGTGCGADDAEVWIDYEGYLKGNNSDNVGLLVVSIVFGVPLAICLLVMIAKGIFCPESLKGPEHAPYNDNIHKSPESGNIN